MNQMRKFNAMDKVSGSPKPTRLILFLLLATIASFVNAKGSATDLASGQYDIQSGALTRSYLLHVPKQLTHPAPLVIVMHGYTGSADSIMSYSGMNEVADEEGFVWSIHKARSINRVTRFLMLAMSSTLTPRWMIYSLFVT